MKTRTRLAAVALISLLGLAGDCRECYCRLETSAASFQSYFQALKGASLNPMERLVYSLVLTRTSTSTQVKPEVPKKS